MGVQETGPDPGGRIQARLNDLIRVPRIMIMADPCSLQKWLHDMYPEAPAEYSVLHAAACHQVLKYLSGLLRQRDGHGLIDHLEQLDKDAPPGQLSGLGLDHLGPGFDADCEATARHLRDLAFADPAAVPRDSYDWAVRALVTAMRHELAYHRKARSSVDVSDFSKLWKLWLPH